MQKPNWFDQEYESQLGSKSVESVLADLAKDKRIVTAVKDALKTHDESSKKPGWAGPSRAQVVRKTVATILNAD
jgi:hypothetical protein